MKRQIIGGSVALVLVGSISCLTGCEASNSQREHAAAAQAEPHKEVEKKIAVRELPPKVVDGVKKALPDGKITDAEEQNNAGTLTYELDVKIGDKVYEVVMSADGAMLSKQLDKDEK